MSRWKLTDDQIAEIRAARDAGQTLEAIAERFGTSKQHVSRLVRGEQRIRLPEVVVEGPGAGQVTGAVISLLDAAGFDPAEDVMAATALALAEKLDACRRSDTAQAAMAAPGLAKALRDTLDELRDQAGDAGPRLGRLRGEEAVLVAGELGYPDPESIDVECFDAIEVIRLKVVRRRAGTNTKGST